MTRRKTIRLWWVVAAFLGGIATAMFAEELILRAQGNRLDFSTPRFHYLTGRPLARLKNAEPVEFAFQVSLAAGNPTNVVKQSTALFVISYDLWEERFAVTKVQPSRKTAGHLTANDAEAWCVQEMSILDLNGVTATQPLWAHMEIRAQEERDSKLFGISDAGISLRGLVDLFSKPAQAKQLRWTLDAGPVTLEQLRRGG